LTLNRSAQFVAAAVLILTVYHKTIPISLYLFYKTRFDDGAKNDSCLIRFLRDAVFPCKKQPERTEKNAFDISKGVFASRRCGLKSKRRQRRFCLNEEARFVSK